MGGKNRPAGNGRLYIDLRETPVLNDLKWKSAVFPRLLLMLIVTSPIHGAADAEDRWNEPVLTVLQRTAEPLLKADCPWEDFCIGVVNVIRCGDLWQMWYDSYDHNYGNDADGYVCYACSQDGVHWQKPDLGLIEYGGNRHNNIVISGPATGGAHGHTVFLDCAAPESERYKAVFSKCIGNGEWWVYGALSPDGIRWTPLPEPLLRKNSDTQSVCFRDRDVYRLYVRMWTGPGTFGGRRLVGYTESATFGAFPDPVAIPLSPALPLNCSTAARGANPAGTTVFAAESGSLATSESMSAEKSDPANLHFYNSAATSLPHGLYLLLPSVLLTESGTLPVHAALGRDGKQFSQPGREPLLMPGEGFDSMGVYVGPGAVPAEQPGAYWFYYCGTSVPHDANLPDKVHGAGGIGRFLLQVEQAELMKTGELAPQTEH